MNNRTKTTLELLDWLRLECDYSSSPNDAEWLHEVIMALCELRVIEEWHKLNVKVPPASSNSCKD